MQTRSSCRVTPCLNIPTRSLVLFFKMVPRLLLVLGSLVYISVAAIPSTTSTITTTNSSISLALSNLTSAPLPAQSNSSAGEVDFRICYCTGMERWSLPKLEPDHCVGALEWLFLETYEAEHRKAKEFRAPGAKSTSHTPAQKTPRKYTFRKTYRSLVA